MMAISLATCILPGALDVQLLMLMVPTLHFWEGGGIKEKKRKPIQ